MSFGTTKIDGMRIYKVEYRKGFGIDGMRIYKVEYRKGL